MNFNLTKSAQVLSVILLAQMAAFYGLSRAEVVPHAPPLAGLNKVLGTWTTVQEGVVEKEVQEILKADDTLTRSFVAPGFKGHVGLFIAAFTSQRNGKAPHSPKNCMPGSGWVQNEQGFAKIAIDGRAEPIEVNRYVVQKGDAKSLVLYWYQTRDRVVASEFSAKGYVVLDALRENRTDSALVRVIVPVIDNDINGAMATATDFVKVSFGPIRRQLPA